jgi:hypothetical protein
MRTNMPSACSAGCAVAASTTIYGRLPPQDDSVGVGGMGCTNLSGLLTERFALLALMGIRCFRPHNTIGRTGLVVDQASKLRSLLTSHQDSSRIQFTSSKAQRRHTACQGAAYASCRVSSAHAIRAVLLARATIVRLKPRRATSACNQVARRSVSLGSRLTTARAPWIIWRLR